MQRVSIKKIRERLGLTLVQLLICLTITSPCFASGYALLIGISEYQDSSVPQLPGVDQDIFRMRKMARSFGVSPHKIEVLTDKAATKSNIIKSLETLTAESSTIDGPIIVYYSGHGSNIDDQDADELDGLDEVLLTYDSEIDTKNNTLKNTLVDDQFFELLSKIPSEKLIVLIDACHSGTSTRSASSNNNPFVPKSLVWREIKQLSNLATKVPSTQPYLTFASSQDHEQSLSKNEGSVFTYYLYYQLTTASMKNEKIAWSQLSNHVRQSIEDLFKNYPMMIFQPLLTGPEELTNRTITFTPPIFLSNSSWNTLESIVKSSAANNEVVSINAKKTGLLDYELRAEKSQHFALLHVDFMDEITVLNTTKTKLEPGHYSLSDLVDEKHVVTKSKRFPSRIVLLSSEDDQTLQTLLKPPGLQKDLFNGLGSLELKIKAGISEIHAQNLLAQQDQNVQAAN